MRKNLFPYILGFLLLVIVFLFFGKTYKELIRYTELTNRHNIVHGCFQNLSKQINNAAVINPDLLKANDSLKTGDLFFTDSLSIHQQLTLLKSTVVDSVNVKIAAKLDTLIKAELAWLLKSNVPDSIIHHKALSHISTLENINALINQGIERTGYLITYRKKQLDESITSAIYWVIAFSVLSLLLLLFTTLNVFKQKSKAQRKAEKLKQTETRLRHTFESMMEGVQLIDYNWRYLYVNDALTKQGHYPKEKMVGGTVMELYPGVEQTDLFKLLQKCMSERIPQKLETEFVFPDGSKNHFELSIQPVPEGVFILSTDITERKKAEADRKIAEEKLEKALEQTKEGLFQIFNASPSGMLLADSESRKLVEVNKNFQATFGYTREDAIGLTSDELGLVSKEGRAILIAKLAKQGFLKNEPMLCYTKEGKTIDCIISADRLELDGKEYFLSVFHDISNIKELQKQVTENEERFQKMFQASGVGIAITRVSDYIYTEVNDTFLEMTGYSRKELIGRTSLEVGLVEDMERRGEVMSQVREKGSIRHAEITLRHKSGRTLDILASSEAFMLNGEKYAINSVYDITERKQVEEVKRALVQTKEGLMKLFNASPTGMMIADIESRKIMEVNKTFLTIFGFTREEAIGLTAETLGMISNETQLKSFTKLKQQGYLRNEEIPAYTKDKNEIDTIFSVELFEMDGKQCLLCIFHDITDMKNMERRVIESENKYRKIIEEAGDVLYTSDGHGKFTYINQRVTALTEYSSEELIGKHFSILIAPEWQEVVRSSYQNQFKYKLRETVMEFLIHTKTGKEKWVEQVVIMQTDKDFVTGFQCIVRDITERKKASLLLIEQKKIIEQKNKDILDSINYAKRIQEAIFPPEELVKELIPESFILFKPKDIISGDFYWVEKFNNKTFIAAVDCTGHGVPGALLSIVGYNLLSKSINEHEHTKPNEILNELSNGINRTLRQTIESQGIKDTMDIALCSIDRETNILEFAGAYNSMYLIRKKELTEIPADRFPIGVFSNGELQKFTNHQVQLEKGDTIYLFSDGYADQFGGPRGKKLKYKGFKEILLSIQHLSINEQKNVLNKTIEEWKWMSEEQTDDILIIGVKI